MGVPLTGASAAAPAADPAAAPAAAPALDPVPAADTASGDVTVTLDVLAPAIPGQKATLRLRGRVINTSRASIDDVSVRLRRSSYPIAERGEIGMIAGEGIEAQSREPTDVPLPGTRVVVAERLAPGEFKPFSIRVPVSAIGFTEPGSYVVAVEALGRQVDVDEFDVRKGMLRTFVPWFPPGTEVDPVRLAWLWPLASWPAQTAGDVLLDNQIPDEVSDGGRLRELLTIGSRHQATVSWIADPSLLQTIDRMSGGYQVARDGVTVVGDGEDAAATWLQDLSQATRVAGLHTLPYADVDASAMTSGGMANDVVRAVTRGPRVAALSVGDPTDGQVYWAPFGRLDRATVNVLASAGVTSIVLSADAMPATNDQAAVSGQPTAALPTDVGTIRAVLTDTALAQTLALPQTTASEVIEARQRFLAETATASQTLDARERTLVAAPTDVRWSGVSSLLAPLLKATRSAPWLEPVTMDELLAEPAPSTSRRRGGYGEKARESELTQQYVAEIARTSADLGVFTSVIDNPTGITEPYSEALLRAQSSAWRSQPRTGDALLGSIRDSLDAETSRVRVLSEGTITFSGDSGKVPVTITNDLDRSVTVGLALRGRPGLRLTSDPIAGIQIEAGKMASVDLDARVIGGDPLSVAVQLLSPEGEDYGKPASITLTSTAYSRAAAWVVAAAFLAIVVFVIVGVFRRIRKARQESAVTSGSGGA